MAAGLDVLGPPVDDGQVLAALLERDRRDSTRVVAPLRVAADATELDTSGMTLDEVVDAIASLCVKFTFRSERCDVKDTIEMYRGGFVNRPGEDIPCACGRQSPVRNCTIAISGSRRRLAP